MKRAFKWLGAVLGTLLVVALAVGGFQLYAFDSAAAAEYDIAPLSMQASTDSAVLARGRHIAESFGGCVSCHGPNLGGRLVDDFGPVGVMHAPNLTTGDGGVGALYSDGELARAIRHGVGADGRSLLLMPTAEHNWWPDADVHAVVSYVRSLPAVSNRQADTQIRPLGKVLAQFGVMEMFSAQAPLPEQLPPPPEPTARYGAYLVRGCEGCHGPKLAGGAIPGAPSNLAKPANLTPHSSGLEGWTVDTFREVMNTGVRPDGRTLDAFMPREAIQNLDAVEFAALWAYLESLPPLPYGTR